MLALFLWMGWHEIAVPLAAIRHGADAVQLGMIKVVAVPVGIGLFGTWLVLGPRVEGLLQDDEGRRRAAPGLVVVALVGVGIGIRLWMGAQAHGAGYAEPPRHEPFTLRMPATVQFGTDQIVFRRDDGQTYTMAWADIVSIGLVGGSRDFTPEVEMHWQFDDAHGVRGSVPQSAIDEATLVEAVRAHFGNQVRERPVARFQADLQAPINAPAVAKGYAQFAEWVYTR